MSKRAGSLALFFCAVFDLDQKVSIFRIIRVRVECQRIAFEVLVRLVACCLVTLLAGRFIERNSGGGGDVEDGELRCRGQADQKVAMFSR